MTVTVTKAADPKPADPKPADPKPAEVLGAVKKVSADDSRFAAVIAARDAARARGEAARERTDDAIDISHRLKLSVKGEIPGFHLYWENDEDGRIEERLLEGFDFVVPGEVQRTSDVVADLDTANRISRYVGTSRDDKPMRAYLMKCPDAIWERKQKTVEAIASQKDAQIERLREVTKDRYIPNIAKGA